MVKWFGHEAGRVAEGERRSPGRVSAHSERAKLKQQRILEVMVERLLPFLLPRASDKGSGEESGKGRSGEVPEGSCHSGATDPDTTRGFPGDFQAGAWETGTEA